MSQGYVAVKCILLWTDTFLIVQHVHQFAGYFVPATRPIKFIKLNYVYYRSLVARSIISKLID